MKFTVERLEGKPILITTVGDDYVVGVDNITLAQAVDAKIGADTSGVYVIFDIRKMKMTFGDLVTAMSSQSRKAPGTMADPRIISIAVGTDELVTLGIKAFEQEQYGKLKFPLYATVEEALAYANEQLAKPTAQ